jgi:hypothetical protein
MGSGNGHARGLPDRRHRAHHPHALAALACATVFEPGITAGKANGIMNDTVE